MSLLRAATRSYQKPLVYFAMFFLTLNTWATRAPFYSNYYAHLCRMHLQKLGAIHLKTTERVIVESITLQRANSFRNATLSSPALSSHLVVESQVEMITGYEVTTRLPKVKPLRSASFSTSLTSLEAEALIAQRNAKAALDYYEELLPGLDFSYGKMQARREFTDAPKLKAEAKNYLNHSNIVEVRDTPGNVVGAIRIIDAPFGAHANFVSIANMTSGFFISRNPDDRSERPIDIGNYGPSVAARELSPNDYAYYLKGIQRRSQEIIGSDVFNGGLTEAMLIEHPLLDTPDMNDHFEALGLYTDQHIGIETGRFTGAERMMMENLHTRELIAAGFANGLLPRIPYMVLYFKGKDKFERFTGNAREVGMLAIEENLPLAEREKISEILFTKFLELMFDPRETPFTNIMGQIFYTYGNGISKIMYKDFGFKEMGPKIKFSGKEADLLHATPLQIIEAFLKKYKRRHPLMTDDFIKLLENIKNDIPKIAPTDKMSQYHDLRLQLQRIVDMMGEIDRRALESGQFPNL